MHGFRKWPLVHVVVLFPDMAFDRTETINLLADYLSAIVESLHGVVVDRHSEKVHQVIFAVSGHPGKLSHGLEA